MSAGIDLKTAQTRLGHSDPRLTLAVYAQATSAADRDAADRVGELLMKQPEVTPALADNDSDETECAMESPAPPPARASRACDQHFC